jgi:hypothetical protein
MAYMISMWLPGDVAFEIIADDTDDPIVTIRVTTPAGELQIMAEVSEEDEGRTLKLQGTHLQSAAGPNAFGVGALRLIAEIVMERMDYEQVVVEGAVRTTGARPGHRPKALRFTRRAGAASGADKD